MPSACCRLMSRHVQRALGARPLLHRSLLRLGRRRGVRAVRGHRACIQGRRYVGATTRLRQRAVHHRRHPALASDDRSAAPRDHRVRDRRARDGAPDRWRRRHGWDRRPSWLLPKMHVYMPDIIRCVKTLLLSLRAAALRHVHVEMAAAARQRLGDATKFDEDAHDQAATISVELCECSGRRMRRCGRSTRASPRRLRAAANKWPPCLDHDRRHADDA